jgi:hypothetical protein
MPWTSTPRRRNGTPIRPVPIANSSARPSPASAWSTPTTGSIAAAWFIGSSGSS